jgi:hypothetical protein
MMICHEVHKAGGADRQKYGQTYSHLSFHFGKIESCMWPLFYAVVVFLKIWAFTGGIPVRSIVLGRC